MKRHRAAARSYVLVLTALAAIGLGSAPARAVGNDLVLRFSPTTIAVGQQFVAIVTGCPAGSLAQVSLSHPVGGGRGTPTWGHRTGKDGSLRLVETVPAEMPLGTATARAVCYLPPGSDINSTTLSNSIPVTIVAGSLPFTGSLFGLGEITLLAVALMFFGAFACLAVRVSAKTK